MPFDPSKSFEKIESGGFDPSKPFETEDSQPAETIAVAETQYTQKNDQTPKREIGGGESAFRGGIDALTFGFGDEVGGAMEALGSMVGIRGAGSPNLKDVRLESDEEDKQSIREIYEGMRERRRSLDKEAQEQAPKSFTAGQIGGGVLSMPLGGGVVKGGQAAFNAARGIKALPLAAKATGLAKLPSLAKAAALEGSVYGAGASEAETAGGVAFDALKGGGVGAAGGVLFGKGTEVVGKGMQSLGRMISKVNPNKNAVEVISAVAFDLPPKYTEALIKHPNLKNIKTPEQLAETIVEISNKSKSDLFKVDELAKSYLTDEKIVDIEPIRDRLTKILEESDILKSEFTADKYVVNKFNEIVTTLENYATRPKNAERLGMGGLISEKDLKTIVQKTQKAVKYGDSDYDTSNKIMREVAADLNDFLKTRNPEYREVMPFVQKALNEERFVNETFSLSSKSGSLSPTDQTYSKLKNFFDSNLKAKKTVTGKDLAEIDADFVNQAEMRQVLDRSQGGVMSGSRNTLMGTLIGSTVGGPLGPVLGATGGYIKDKYGRKIGRELIDSQRENILRRDEIFQELGKKFGRAGEKVAGPMKDLKKGIQTGFTAATVPKFIADELGKDLSNMDEQEKRATTRIYLMKKQNPSMSEKQVIEYMKKTVPGYSRKKAADDF